jgi:DNA-binding MarR family transcriptional regulator
MNDMKDIYEIVLKLKYFCNCNESRISLNCHISLAELKGIQAIEEEEVITCSEFSEKIKLSTSRSSRIIDNLVRKGLLTRKIKDYDRRTTWLCLTKKGAEIKENINQEQKKFEQLLSSELNREDIELIEKGLKILENLIKNHTKKES